jgi:SAM-dependent methyltransferase
MATAPGLEPDVQQEQDSATRDDSSLMTSVAGSIYEYRKEHGRTYHSYREGNYPFPNDETELERLELQHHLFSVIQDDQLFLAPIKDPKNVLDLGTGTGTWAIEFADKYPDAQVIGTDLSPVAAQWVPSNLSFEVDDANDDWAYKTKFDFIHVREMQMSMEEKKLFKQAFEHLAPGGWFEIKGGTLPFACDDESFKGTSLEEWSSGMVEISSKLGRPFTNPFSYKQWLEEAGFINVTEKMLPVPINSWPKDAKMKLVGSWQQVNLLHGLQGFTVKLFTEFKGYTEEQVTTLLEKVKKDLGNKSIHAFLKVMVLTAQKPSS